MSLINASSIQVEGVELSAVAAGIRSQERLDLLLVDLCADTTTAAVFTTNHFCAAPVQIAQQHLRMMSPRALLFNSGNANAGTGARGIRDAKECCAQLAARSNIQPYQVLPFSTGVIGEYLPMPAVCQGIRDAYDQLSADAWDAAARAIMTTDTVPKCFSTQLLLDDRQISICGIAKGSGMIRPDMATMLAFIATDAAVNSQDLDACLRRAVAGSFNCISVDGDMSTNDACVLSATGRSGCLLDPGADPANWEQFQAGINSVCESLAKALVRDGEGATKFVEIRVNEGLNQSECKQVAYAIAHSPLVKTALFASDPNWGRVLSTVGACKLSNFDIDKVAIIINGVSIVTAGERDPGYQESLGRQALAPRDIAIDICLRRGRAYAKVWTTDLSHDYVRINAEYRS